MADIWIIEPPGKQSIEVPGKAAQSLLARQERARARALAAAEPGRGEQYCAFRLAMRSILARSGAALAPRQALARGTHGKPYFPGGPEFSFSATQGLALVAVSQHSQIGIDVERIRDIEAADAALKSSPALQAMAEPARDAGLAPTLAFLRAWTRLEASLKLAGLALAPALSDLDLSSWRPPAAQRAGGEPERTISDLDVGHGFVASLAHHPTDAPRLSRFDWVEWLRDLA